MKKENVVKTLALICFLTPGNIKARKAWFFSIISLLSLIALAFSIGSLVVEIIGYRNFSKSKHTNELYKSLEHKPIRAVAYCLTSDKTARYTNETTTENESVSTTKPTEKNAPHHSGLLEDIVNTAYRLLVFGGNILVRIFIWISFTTVIDLLKSVFSAQEGRSEMQNHFMMKLWVDSAQKWSGNEKIFFFIVILSQSLREIELVIQFNTSIVNTGVELLDMSCVLIEAIVEQARIQFTRELVMEVSTFVLIITMKAFENVLATIAGQSEEDSENEYDSNSGISLADDKMSNESGKIFDERVENSDLLFVKTQAMLLKAEMSRKAAKGRNPLILPNGMSSNYNHVSEIVSSYENDHNPDLSIIFQNSKEKRISAVYPIGNDRVDVIYSQMNFIISMYFELMTLWERAGRLTGFITLLLFCELTTTFCFNTYITLDNSMEFGLLSVFGILGLLRGIIIVTKFVCVCNSAQALRDMTPVLLDRVLKLKLQLLSLPSDCYRTRGGKSGPRADGGHMAPYECERCRGLGSFLSEMVSYIRAHPFELSALGYFTVSRSTLTTITGVIVTYLVVLVQFQSYSSS